AESSNRRRFGLFSIHRGIEHGVDRASEVQGGVLKWVLNHRVLILVQFAIAVGSGVFSGMNAGREFFPRTDAGLLGLFVRVPTGARVDDTGAVMAEIQRDIRQLVPKEELSFIVENVGAPNSINLAWVESTAI